MVIFHSYVNVFQRVSNGFGTHDPYPQVVLEVQGRPRGRSGQGAFVQLRSGSVLVRWKWNTLHREMWDKPIWGCKFTRKLYIYMIIIIYIYNVVYIYMYIYIYIYTYNITARRCVLPGRFKWRLNMFKHYPSTCSNTCTGPVFWYFPDDEH